jgi:hypothetical protein
MVVVVVVEVVVVVLVLVLLLLLRLESGMNSTHLMMSCNRIMNRVIVMVVDSGHWTLTEGPRGSTQPEGWPRVSELAVAKKLGLR